MKTALRREILALLFAVCIVIVLGSMTGLMLELLLVTMCLYVVWSLYNISLMIRWLSKPSKNHPKSVGIWDEIYYQLYHLYRRQRKAKKKLSSIVMRFQESTQAMPFAAIVLNSNNEIQWFNRAAGHMFNLQQGRDIGERITSLIRNPEFFLYLSKKKFDDAFEFKFNYRQISLSVTPYSSGDYLVNAIDITQQRMMDDMRRDFIANASHELRTPITVIAGYAEILQDQVDTDSAVPIKKILQQTDRVQKIIEDLMVLARLESRDTLVDIDKIDIAEVLSDVYSDAKILDEDRHELILAAEPAIIEGSRDELQMAVLNLVTNAIRYTPEKNSIRIYSEKKNGHVVFGVNDSGIGIMPEHLPRLTERFYRVDPGRSREQGGTGLGLAIVKHVADRHDARLLINSVLGEGSDFRLEFELGHDA